METTRSLFIVAPDANAATLKKLRGIGVATGTNIVATQNASELPSHPPAFATLLIPDHLIDHGVPKNEWHRVFEISRNQHIDIREDRNVIVSKDPLSDGHDWIQIVNKFVRNFLDEETHCRWHSIQRSWSIKSLQCAAELGNWMDNHQIKKTSRLSCLLKSLAILDQITASGHSNHQDCIIHANMDTKYFEIKLEIPYSKPFESERLQNAFSGIDTSLLAFTRTNESLLVKIQLSLNVSSESSFIVISTCQRRDSIGAQPEKEAS